MALPTTGWLPVPSDRYLLPIKVSQAAGGNLRIDLPYEVRVGLVGTPHQVFTETAQTETAIKNAWASLFYAVQEGLDGEQDPNTVIWPATEP